MIVELREWMGIRTTFAPGTTEPVWWFQEQARNIGNVVRAARCLELPVSKLREILHYAQANSRSIAYERQTALEAGLKLPPLRTALPSLVFPADTFRQHQSRLRSPEEGFSRRGPRRGRKPVIDSLRA
jgi:hypothetical protein